MDTSAQSSTIVQPTSGGNANNNSESMFLLTIIVVVVVFVCVLFFIVLVIVATVIFVRKWVCKTRSNNRRAKDSSHKQVAHTQESSSRMSDRNSISSLNSSSRYGTRSLQTSDARQNSIQATYQTIAEESTHSKQSLGFSNSLALSKALISTSLNADGNTLEPDNDNGFYDVVKYSEYADDHTSTPTEQVVYDEPAFDENNDPTSYYLLGQSTNESIYSCARFVEENKKQDIYKRVRPYALPRHKEGEIYSQLKSFGICNISHRAIRITGHLGSGQFGNVEKGSWKTGKNNCEIEVALKTMYIGSSTEDKVRFLQEAAIMAQFRHPNVLLLFGVVSQGEPMTIVVELAQKGDLRKYLNNINSVPAKRMSVNLPSLLLNFCQQIALGMQYLAGKHFVHRDLAARNILLSKNNECKIADFGMARDLADENYYISRGGKIPVKWTAPEALNYKKYSTASDIWSYGCLLYEIWSLGKKPFNTMRNMTVVKLLGKGMRLSPPPGCPELIYDLMIKCWHPDKDKRPKFRNIFLTLVENEETLLVIPDSALASHKQAGMLGAPVEAGERMYLELRRTYETVKFDYESLPSSNNDSTSDANYY